MCLVSIVFCHSIVSLFFMFSFSHRFSTKKENLRDFFSIFILSTRHITFSPIYCLLNWWFSICFPWLSNQSCWLKNLLKNFRQVLKSTRKTLMQFLSSTLCSDFSPKPKSHVNSLTALSPFSNFLSSSNSFCTNSSFSSFDSEKCDSIEFNISETDVKFSLLIIFDIFLFTSKLELIAR